MIFIDTNIAIKILNDNDSIEILVDKYGQNEFAISTPSIFELFHGIYKLKYLKKDLSLKKYKTIKNGLKRLIKELHVFILDLDSADLGAKLFMQLKSEGKEIDVFDCLITAIILSNGFNELITNNQRHFKRFKKLNLFSF